MLNSLAFANGTRSIYLHSNVGHVPKKLPQTEPHLSVGAKKALVSRAVAGDEFTEIIPTTVRPNGSVHVGRESKGERAIVIVLSPDSALLPASDEIAGKAGSK